MTTRKKWTKEEEEILVQAITANPHNITEACKKVSVKLSRTWKACIAHWYIVIAPASNPTKIGVTFMAIGAKSIYKNRKNSGKALANPERTTLWAKIKKLIRLK